MNALCNKWQQGFEGFNNIAERYVLETEAE